MTRAARTLLLLLAVAALLLVAAASVPLLVPGDRVALAWWAIAGVAAVFAACEVLSTVRLRRAAAALPPPPSRDASAIDFDRPWKGP